jgi:hypothetical protein
METEPPKANPPKGKRRWFQFRLRSLLIGVTLAAIPCGYVGWQAKIVRDRKAFLQTRNYLPGDSSLDVAACAMDAPPVESGTDLSYYRLRAG